ncbi:H-NS histone family protein [Bradyrhizobium cenepequi]|uniref:H-NS histone family protein n=1 Tax=Bradyrhizobium cenepequi TaxID=2821403 RepID=UPI0028A08FD5|nr:H-NS histone family protein [Bradyrhizobium cenepequi]MCA6109295.1 H-NS histone family protein [Bradyrhizobium cenepequi]
MRRAELEKMDLDRLWTLHVEISDVLKEKITQQKQRFVDRLNRLEQPLSGRRPYPRVSPKYRNPDDPAETWAGRGRCPRWLAKQLQSGRRMDEFRI